MIRKAAIVGLVVLAAALPLTALSSEGSSARWKQTRVRTLVTIRGPVTEFVQDGKYVAWGSPGCRVVVRRLGTRTSRAFAGGYCESPVDLVLDGGRAVWVDAHCGNSCYAQVMSAALGERRASTVGDELVVESDGGVWPSDLAADGNLYLAALLWASPCDSESSYGPPVLSGGAIDRVSGGTFERFLDLPAALLAMHTDRVAAVPPGVSGCAYNEGPDWSPDGRLIAFASRRVGPDWEIEAVPFQGGALRKITDNWRYDGAPAWAPNGASLAIVTPDSIRTVDLNGTTEQTVVSCPAFDCSSAAWAPDGSRLAFSRTGNVFTVNRDGSGELPLASGNDPSFSPDGERIVFTRGLESGVAIYVMDANGTNEQRLAGGDDSDWVEPSFSPDGRTIVFTKRDDRDSEIYAMNADGSGVRKLTDNLVDDYSPDWSPDGSRLAFSRMAGGKEEIYVMSADGSGQARLTETKLHVTRFPVEIHSTRDGSLVSRFMPAGEVWEIALTPRVAAVLLQQGRERRIALFNPSSGARLGSVRVPRGAESLSAAGRTVVFRTGRTIRILDAVRRKHTVLTIAKSKPIGLSIDEKRVAWAESGKKRSRIQAVLLAGG